MANETVSSLISWEIQMKTTGRYQQTGYKTKTDSHVSGKDAEQLDAAGGVEVGTTTGKNCSASPTKAEPLTQQCHS